MGMVCKKIHNRGGWQIWTFCPWKRAWAYLKLGKWWLQIIDCGCYHSGEYQMNARVHMNGIRRKVKPRNQVWEHHGFCSKCIPWRLINANAVASFAAANGGKVKWPIDVRMPWVRVTQHRTGCNWWRNAQSSEASEGVRRWASRWP